MKGDGVGGAIKFNEEDAVLGLCGAENYSAELIQAFATDAGAGEGVDSGGVIAKGFSIELSVFAVVQDDIGEMFLECELIKERAQESGLTSSKKAGDHEHRAHGGDLWKSAGT